MDKISIIVPVYNGGATLLRCVNSIVNQSYTNLEIILVNDGSTDSSFAMCEDFSKQDQRIRVINQDNTGRNIARNHGMEASTGDFISFMDQDDFLDPNYFKDLHKQVEEYNSDIAICDYKFFDQKTPQNLAVITNEAKTKSTGVYSTDEWMTRLGDFYQTIEIPVIVPWAKIIRRSCIKDVSFPHDRSLAEDIKTMWKFYLNAKRISFKTNPDYINQQHPDPAKKLAAMMYGSVNALEEQIAFLGIRGFDVTSYFPVYIHYLKMALNFSKQLGDVDIYDQVSFKLNHLEH